MKVHRDRDWDKGVYEINIKSGERLVIESEHGEFFVDHLGNHINLFTVLKGRWEETKGNVTQISEGIRLEFAQFKNKQFINPQKKRD